MEATALVEQTLQALQHRDFEQHVAYVSDQVIVEQAPGHEPLLGKEAYRAYIEQFKHFPPDAGLMSFQVTPLPPSTDVLTWVMATSTLRNFSPVRGQRVEPETAVIDIFYG